jgi:hypothetical protein
LVNKRHLILIKQDLPDKINLITTIKIKEKILSIWQHGKSLDYAGKN